jgi:ArsR family transcriptional regulator
MAKPADNCATILKVLADETRLAVVRQLMEGPQQVNEMNATLQLEQSLLSHHLRILRDAGIVRSQRDGKAVLYRLSEEVLAGIQSGESLNLGCCQLSFKPSA